ncbi:hypothetical protein K461DRAFT_290349 [Myriangium duriaei CBS 260.36]|uniref:Uncharacterized protein n=1 Tax=Myriangium duriaei CBS 260.36 TaxID=1168546 RepID=A0A9P4MMA8_9PEZI|nr:hypothetical protein K461DRAFT_290349 [Myriangium duriaei CBS 260.36]
MSYATEDPWRWNISEVKSWVRNQLPQIAKSIPNALLPDLPKLANSFEEQEISGHVLLTDVTTDFLKAECNIRAHGRRSTVLNAIRELRRASTTYSFQSLSIPDQNPARQPIGTQIAPLFSAETSFNEIHSPSSSRADLSSTLLQVKLDSQSVSLVRKRESLVDDGTGRKRRKLDLTAQPSPFIQEIVSTDYTSAAQPILGFLPQKKFSLDELIYGDVGPGEPIPDTPEEEHDVFTFAYSPLALGTRQFAKRQMLHLFQAPYQSVSYRGKSSAALFPYRESLLLPGVQRSLTVIPESDEDSPIRITEAMLIDDGHAPLKAQGNNEWDFLLGKYPAQADDEVLPLYKKADSENSSISSSLFAEMKAEEEERARALHGKLSKEQAESVIDSAIEELVDVWYQSKRARLEERSAHSLWRSGRATNSKARTIRKQNKIMINHLGGRLEKMRGELLIHLWNTEKELRKQCAILQPTIEDLELEKWKQALWKRPVAPPPHQGATAKRHLSSNGVTENPPLVDVDHQMSESDSFVVEDGHELTGATGGAAISSDWSSPLRPSQRRRKHGPHADETVSLPELELLPDEPIEEVDADLEAGYEMASNADSLPALAENTITHIGSSPPLLGAAAPSDDDISFTPLSDDTSAFATHKSERSHATASLKDRANVNPNTAKPKSDVVVISSDISSGSSDDSPAKPSAQQDNSLKGDPHKVSKRQISGWNWAVLMRSVDRKRLISKVILSLEEEIRGSMCGQFMNNGGSKEWLYMIVTEALGERNARQKSPINGNYYPTTRQRFARLYSCWNNVDRAFWDRDLPENLWTPEIDTHDLDGWADYVAKELPRITQFSDTEDEVETFASNTSSHPGKAIVISDSSDDRVVELGKKKRRVKPDAGAKAKRENAIHRMEKYNESQKQDIEAILLSSDREEEEVLVNIAKTDDEAPVYFNPEIVRRLKNHQIDGVRFMWREVTEEGGQGCVLAHTMGLGKTCQAVTILVVLKEAIENPLTCAALPEDLRSLRALVLCPPTVLQNWEREIEQWSPPSQPKFFRVFKIDSTGNDQQERLEILRDWSRTNGILLMGYEMFRRLTQVVTKNSDDYSAPKPSECPQSSNKLGIQEQKEVALMLLNSATLVIADEAHQLRNEATAISQSARRIKVQRRIALTGTPMSNDSQEIFSLINWVAPNYLGSSTEFRSRFGIPIAEGNYADSTREQVRKAKRKLEVLNKEIAPKINRADITVLKGALPTKTEYSLTIPLTDLQIKIYRKYVDFITGDLSRGEKRLAQMEFLGWIANLTLLCNHPNAFRKKLLESKPTNNARHSDIDDSEHVPADDEHVTNLGLTPKMIQELAADIPEIASAQASYRMVLIEKILSLSLQNGDKVLIFSQSLPTLDCMQEFLNALHARWRRIDGNTEIPKRDKILAELRSGKLDVLVISTKAGGQGLNMQDANRVIIIDYGWNPSLEEQAVGRAYRLGQKKDVFVYRFIAAGTFEDKLYNTGVFKSQLSSRVIDKKNPVRQAQKDLKDWIFYPRAIEQGDVDSECGKDPKVLDLILAKQRSGEFEPFIKSIRTMETLQREGDDEPLNAEEEAEVRNESLHLSMIRRKVPVSAPRRSPAAPFVSTARVSSGHISQSATLPHGEHVMTSSMMPASAFQSSPHGINTQLPPVQHSSGETQLQQSVQTDSTRPLLAQNHSGTHTNNTPLTFAMTQQGSNQSSSHPPQLPPRLGDLSNPEARPRLKVLFPHGKLDSFFHRASRASLQAPDSGAYQLSPPRAAPSLQHRIDGGDGPRNSALLHHLRPHGSASSIASPASDVSALPLPSIAPPYQLSDRLSRGDSHESFRTPERGNSPATIDPHSRTPSLEASEIAQAFSASFGAEPGAQFQ